MKLPRFTLRELFLLVVIAAIGCGWWVEHSRAVYASSQARVWAGRTRALEWMFEQEGFVVDWDKDREWVESRKRNEGHSKYGIVTSLEHFHEARDP